jgi:hypothetical protein
MKDSMDAAFAFANAFDKQRDQEKEELEALRKECEELRKACIDLEMENFELEQKVEFYTGTKE